MKKADIIIIVVFLFAAIAAFGFTKLHYGGSYDEKYAVIYIQTQVYKKIPIPDKSYSEKIEVKNNFGKNIIQIKDGGAVILDADCHDQICVKSGFVDSPGQTIVCLPHQLVVEIVGKQKGNAAETDEVAY